jgi:hypothetical protein
MESGQDVLRAASPADGELFRKLLLDGQNRTDVGHEVIKAFGYSIVLGDALEKGTHIECQCSGVDGPPNYAFLRFDARREDVPTDAKTMRMLVTTLADVWNAEIGVVASKDYERAGDRVGAPLNPGWMWLLRVPPRSLPALPRDVRVEPWGTAGSLVVTTEEPFCAANPEHVARARWTYAALEGAGLLRVPV